MVENSGRFVLTVFALTVFVHGACVLFGGELYNGQHKDKFREVLERKVRVYVKPDSDKNLSLLQEKFLNQFLRNYNLIKNNGDGEVYNVEGKQIPYDSLARLMEGYIPNK